MPRLAMFYGIEVYMFYRDHSPPHFHAIYGSHEAVIEISSGRVRAGRLPRRALRLVREWLGLYKVELETDWELARAGRPLHPISPLD